MKHSFFRLLLSASIIIGVGLSGAAQLLWKVTEPGSGRVSYLFGTHHLAPISVIESTDGLTDALQSVEAVIGEIDMNEAQSLTSQMTMQRFMMAPADSMLSNVLTPSQMDSLTVVVQKYLGPQATAAQLNQLTPTAVATIIGMQQAAATFPGRNPLEQLDTEMQKRALALGKAVKGFETVEFQCRRLFGAPIAEQARSLMAAVRGDESFAAMAKDLTDAYLAGNLEKMFSLITDPTTGFSDADAERLLYSRNADWTDFLMGALPAMSVLVVVGAGHLPGEKGLIKALQNRGMKVEPVNSSSPL